MNPLLFLPLETKRRSGTMRLQGCWKPNSALKCWQYLVMGGFPSEIQFKNSEIILGSPRMLSKPLSPQSEKY